MSGFAAFDVQTVASPGERRPNVLFDGPRCEQAVEGEDGDASLHN